MEQLNLSMANDTEKVYKILGELIHMDREFQIMITVPSGSKTVLPKESMEVSDKKSGYNLEREKCHSNQRPERNFCSRRYCICDVRESTGQYRGGVSDERGRYLEIQQYAVFAAEPAEGMTTVCKRVGICHRSPYGCHRSRKKSIF